MYDLDRTYDEAFYEQNLAEGLLHAEWFVPLLTKIFRPESVLDLGCGRGHFVSALRTWGVNAWGIEGAQAAIVSPYISAHDLRKPIALLHLDRFDLALSIEVAEHIEKEYADVFVDTLVTASDHVVMTAAPPGQGGTMHVNEQPPIYWLQKFTERGYEVDLAAQSKLLAGISKAREDGHHVAAWWETNLLVFRRAQ